MVVLRAVDCDEEVFCHSTFTLAGSDLADIQACYGHDPYLGWLTTPPDAIYDFCAPPETECTFDIGRGLAYDVISECTCEQGEGGDPAPEGCCRAPAELTGDDAFIAQVWADCAIDLESDSMTSCDEPEGELAGQCLPFTALLAPAADYVLHMDPDYSYVEITTSQGVASTAVGGGGSTATGPARFLTAALWAIDDVEIDGQEMTDWVFWFDAPVEMNLASGTFALDVADTPLIKGVGAIDDEYYRLSTEAGQSATGTIDSQTDEWTLDYTEGSSPNSVTVHLEGPLEAL